MKLVHLDYVNAEVDRRVKGKEQVHIAMPQTINVNVPRMWMPVLILARPVNLVYVNAVLLQVVLVTLPELSVMRQIINVNVLQRYRRVQIQGKRVAHRVHAFVELPRAVMV